MNSELLSSFITFFTVIDPIGTIPVFIAVSANYKGDKKKLAHRAALVATAVLLFFIILGEIILNSIDIPLHTFQIAGGIVLFLFALTMIFGESKPNQEMSDVDQNDDKAVFPLAMPSLASPGAILAAILLTDNTQNEVVDQVLTTSTMLAVMVIAWVFMLLASWIFKYIGNSGAAIISRVMGLILASVAVGHVLEGVSKYFGL